MSVPSFVNMYICHKDMWLEYWFANFQAFSWSWSGSYECYGLPFIYDGWSMLFLFWVPLRSYACLNKLPHINGSFNYSIILFCTNSFVFQLFDLSGILTVFFCGIVMSHYTWHSMTDGSKVTTKWVNQIPKQPHLFLIYCGKNYLYLAYCSLLISGIPLQHFRSFVKYVSSFMLVWMHWTWKSGSLLATGSAHMMINC